MKATRSLPFVLIAACLTATAATALHSRETRESLAPAPTAVAVVDMQTAINSSTEIKSRNEGLRVRAESRQAEIEKLKTDLEKLVDSAKVLGDGTAEGVKARAEAVVKRSTLDAQFQAYKQLTDIESGDILGDIHAKVIAAVETIAKREGYQLVLADDRGITIPKGREVEAVGNAINSRRVLFAEASIDITERVLTAMNNEYEAGKSK